MYLRHLSNRGASLSKSEHHYSRTSGARPSLGSASQTCDYVNPKTYLEGLSALHSAVAQADGARASGIPVRREPIETIHPVIRAHPAMGWKSVYVNPGRSSTLSPVFLGHSLTSRSVIPVTCILTTRRWMDRLYPANSGRAKNRIGRNTCVSIRSDKPEPRLTSPVQVGTE